MLMLLQEFIDRTGYYPNDVEWERITQEYSEGKDDKDHFCRRWRRLSLKGASERAVNLLLQKNIQIKDLEEHIKKIQKEQAAYKDKVRNLEDEITALMSELQKVQRNLMQLYNNLAPLS